MAQTAIINIRMDEDLKDKFGDFCTRTGMTMSTAICMFARDTVRNQSLPFVVTTKRRSKIDPFWSVENQEKLRASIAELDAGKTQIHEVIDVYD